MLGMPDSLSPCSAQSESFGGYDSPLKAKNITSLQPLKTELNSEPEICSKITLEKVVRMTL